MSKFITRVSILLGVLILFSNCTILNSLLGESGEDSTSELTLLAALALSQSSDTGCTYAVNSDTTTTTTGNYTVVDTGQTTCYNSTTGATQACGTGASAQDGQYAGTQPSYTAGTNTVLDNRTSLTWTKSPDTNGDSTVTSSDKMTQLSAYNYCASLTVDGQSDWRLPSVKELYSLMNFGQGLDPSSCTNCTAALLSGKTFIDDSVFTVGFGDTSAGERLIDGQYATTSVYGGKIFDTDTGVFGVNFVDGRIKGYECNSTKTYFVHCVRGNTDYGKNNFTNNGNGTVSDSATGLMWQQADDGTKREFDAAITYCEALSLGGQTDWRLPNIKELQSILDYSRAPDYTGSAAINAVFTASTFTNEEAIIDYPWFWSSTTHLSCGDTNCTTADGKAGAYMTFGRALGFYNNAVSDVHGAGSQRSNYKTVALSNATAGASGTDAGNGTFYYWGPQGDVLRGSNYVRCVR